ncbi:hypothetical protein BVC80_1837g95 [Macleaya cordata]|uniref:Uncharacterized protein n=1 Tax=Macleaya cordata TaxID=56857 RepID=A0A200R3K4_MACCD|nr:hypothetical protein BVC80_1837g95 [Macleaya cordata]
MRLGDSMRKHGSELSRSQAKIYSTKNLYAQQTGYMDRNEIHQGKNLRESGKHTRATRLSRTEPDCHSKEFSKVKKDLEPKYSPLFEEEYTSVDVESGLGSFHTTSLESDPTSLEWKYGSEDLFGAYSESKVHTNTQSLCKRTKPDASLKRAPSFRFDKAVFQQPFSPVHYDPHIFSVTESSSRKPDTSQVSRTEDELPHSSHLIDSQGDAEFPVLSGQGNDGRECEDKSEFRRTDCVNFPKPEKEVSVGNNGFLSENDRSADDTNYKDTNSECKETKDETPELTEKPKTRESSELSEQTSLATKEIPDKLEICINDKKYHFDAGFPFPSQSGSKVNAGKGDTEAEKSCGSKDPSYLVMLESYVLQLLCVQKVLTEEASEQESVKKV